MIDVIDLRQWIIGTALLFFVGALVVKSLPDRIRRKLLSVGAVVFIIGSVFATISAQKSGCPDDDSNDGDIGEIAELLIPSCVTDPASLRSTNDTEDDLEGGDVWCLTNRVSFDSFAMTTTSRVFGIGWSQGLSSYFPLLDLAYKQDLTNEEWSVFRTEDVGGSMTNGIVVVVPTVQMPTNAVPDKGFYKTAMRKDPNPQRNTDGDYWSDRDELGFVEVLSGADYLWFELADIGTDLIYPARRKDYLWKRVDFVANHVLGDSVCKAAQVGLDGYVYFRDIESPFDEECCPVIHTVEIDPTADVRYWGSGVYCGSVVTNGVTYDVLEFLNIGLFDCYGMSSSPLVSYEVILSSAEPDVIYVSYANVDAEFLSRQERIGYVDSTRTSVFDPELPYRLVCHDGGGAICPYTTVRYNIGTGTDPRVYDAYDYPIYGQTDAERMFVETSVGYGLTNGLYELKATLTEVPVSPVVITVGDDVIVMTNAGDCVFLCEKGTPYSLSVSPSFSPEVEFTACDDIAPAMMSGALQSTGWGGAEWTVDNRLTLDQPFGGVPGYCLWLPTFTAGPGVSSHWYPGDGALSFSAYLIDYPGTNHVSYSWSCTNSDVVIDSPSSQSTSVRLAGNPGWGVASLTASALVNGYMLTSILENVYYGTNENPTVSIGLTVPDGVFVDGALERIVVDCRLEGDKFGSMTLSQFSGNGKVRFRRWENGGPIERLPLTIDAFYSQRYELYVEGVDVSDSCDDIGIRLEYFGNGGEYLKEDRFFTCAMVNKVQVRSSVAGVSANPPPFDGQSNYVFDVTHSISPDKHLPIFFKDVKTDDFGISDFSVRISLDILPTGYATSGESASWFMLDPSPQSGYVVSRNATEAEFCNPKVGGVYKIGCVYAGSPTNTCNIVLPLAGAAIDAVVASDLAKADRAANFLVANYNDYERQLPQFGLQWFNNDGMGDYLGRPDSAIKETVWEYNQVNDDTGMGAAATWFGLPIRIAKVSNFMVGYATTKIGVCSFLQYLSQLVGTLNDDSARLSWDAGVAVANGSNYVEYVSAMISNSWSEVDEKVSRLWPNVLPCDNHVDGDSLTDYNFQFISPGFLERVSK